MSIDREETLALEGDHSSICKFDSKDSLTYQFVEDHVANLARNAAAALDSARRLVELDPPGSQRRVEDISLNTLASM